MSTRETEPIKISYLGVHPVREAQVASRANLNQLPHQRDARNLARLRASILEAPTSLQNIDVQALENGLDKIEATKPVLIFEPIFLHAIARKLGESLHTSLGFYSDRLGMSFVQRNSQLEDLNSPRLTESFAIHEASHSVHPTPTLTERYNPLVRGVTLPPMHSALSEGVAEYDRGQYVLDNDLVGDFTKNVPDYGFLRASQIPAQYMFTTFEKDREDQPFLAYPEGAFGATILDILAKNEQEIPGLIRKSRRNLSGVSELYGAMNEMMPGLAAEMIRTKADDAGALLNKVERRFGPAKD